MTKVSKVIRLLLTIFIGFFTIYSLELIRYFQEPYILGYEPNTLYNLIRILFPIPLCMFGSYVAFTKVAEYWHALSPSQNHDSETTGTILDIQYSSTRVGNRPLFMARIRYNGHEKVFDYVPETIQHHYKVGDEIRVLYNSQDINDAHPVVEKKTVA